MLQQSHGDPVGDGSAARWYETVTVFYPNQRGKQAVLHAFLEYLLELDEAKDEGELAVYSFHMKVRILEKSWHEAETLAL